MMLAVMLILTLLLMTGAVLTAIAIGAAGKPIEGLDDGIDDLARVILYLVLSALLVLQAIVWLFIGSIYGGAW